MNRLRALRSLMLKGSTVGLLRRSEMRIPWYEKPVKLLQLLSDRRSIGKQSNQKLGDSPAND